MKAEMDEKDIVKHELKRKRPRLGDMLVELGIITREQLGNALQEQRRTNERLGHIFIRLGYATEEEIMSRLGSQLGIPRINLAEIGEIPREVRDAIPEYLVRRRKLFPISKEEQSLVVAMADPLDVFAIDDIRLMIGNIVVDPVIASEKEIDALIEKYYGRTALMEEIMKGLETGEVEVKEATEEAVDLSKLTADSGSAVVVKLVNHFFREAIRREASDIHIEPYERYVRVRYRIDGILYDADSPPKALQSAVISRVKIISRLDIAERRLPQDGRAKVRIAGRDIDLRVSVTPTAFGEKVVLRILDPESLCLDLLQLGFEEDDLKTYEEKIRSPWGFILITGPTGSGKTTTLYSTLATINSPEKNIMTVEDPIEYILPGINQQLVHPDIGLDFATGLRSFLRQDPDIILVGEVRDRETAETAINAALTGHLVFSTLHTNDAAGAVTRLTNMGVEPFLIASTLVISVAQRLVRLLCPKCREPYEAPPAELKQLGIGVNAKITLYRPNGCNYCNQIGYKGREGVYELLAIDDEIKELIVDREPSSIIKEKAIAKGMHTLHESAIKKVLEGKTCVEEMLRITA